MTILFLKKYVSNLFYGINKNILNILENDIIYLNNKNEYDMGLKEIIGLLTFTLTKMEDIYFKYFLFPRLQQITNRIETT
jgi:hypothetical protein